MTQQYADVEASHSLAASSSSSADRVFNSIMSSSTCVDTRDSALCLENKIEREVNQAEFIEIEGTLKFVPFSKMNYVVMSIFDGKEISFIVDELFEKNRRQRLSFEELHVLKQIAEIHPKKNEVISLVDMYRELYLDQPYRSVLLDVQEELAPLDDLLGLEEIEEKYSSNPMLDRLEEKVAKLG